MRGFFILLIMVLISGGTEPVSATDEKLESADEVLIGLPIDDESFINEALEQQNTNLQVSPQARELLHFLRTIPYRNEVINIGESLVFSVRYGPLRAGEVVITLAGIEEVKGDSCYHVVATAATNDFVSAFFHVRDYMESFLDMETLLPVRNQKHLLEGDYENKQGVKFDQSSHFAFYDDGGVFEIPPKSHDVLSSFINLRMRHLAPGMSFDLPHHVDRKNYPIQFNTQRRERIKVPAGEFDCLVVQPVIRTPKLFQHKGKIWIWLTDDERKIPVQMKSELTVGAFSIVLTEIRTRQAGETG